MKIIFTHEDFSYNLIKYVRSGLLAQHHTVVRLVERTKPAWRLILRGVRKSLPVVNIDGWGGLPGDADMWFHGLSYEKRLVPLDPVHADRLRDFPGAIAFYQNDDGFDFFLDKIPDDLIGRAKLFLRNHWPADESKIPAVIRGRTGFISPYLHRMRPEAGETLGRRRYTMTFYGLNTGERLREKALSLLRGAGVGLHGGLLPSEQYPVPPALCVRRLSPKKHLRILSQSKICLALWGNCPLTFRFFEGLSRRCLVLAQDLGAMRFVSCGLKPGIHYAVVKGDLSDLLEKTSYYHAHPDEAQAVADAGFRHFRDNLSFRGVKYPDGLFNEITASWKGLLRPVEHPSLSSLVLAKLLPYINSI